MYCNWIYILFSFIKVVGPLTNRGILILMVNIHVTKYVIHLTSLETKIEEKYIDKFQMGLNMFFVLNF